MRRHDVRWGQNLSVGVHSGAWLVLLLALLGMHGLAPHMEAGGDATANPLTEMVASSSVGHTASHVTDSVVAASTLGTPAQRDHGGPVHLCLAILVGAVVLLFAAQRSSRETLLSQRGGWSQFSSVLRSRSHDPPTLAELSLLRC